MKIFGILIHLISPLLVILGVYVSSLIFDYPAYMISSVVLSALVIVFHWVYYSRVNNNDDK